MKIVPILLFIFLSFTVAGQELDITNYNTQQAFLKQELIKENGSVILFLTPDCAYNKYYVDRIESLFTSKKYTSIMFYVMFIGTPETSDDKYSSLSHSNLQILTTNSKTLPKEYALLKAPSVVVLDGEGTALYKGAIDNTPQKVEEHTLHYLSASLDAFISGKNPPYPMQRPAGCVIR